MINKEDNIRHVLPLSGKDSLCTAIVQKERRPDLNYEYVFCDVDAELPETYEWLDIVEKKLGITIQRIGKSLEQMILVGGTLPSQVNRFCTLQAKIQPYSEWLEEGDVDVIYNYIGYRYDERDRIPVSGVSRLKALEHTEFKEVYPLVEEQVSLKDVYRIIEHHQLPLPNFFWQRLWDAVYSKCGPATKEFLNDLPQWEKSRLFSWRSRSNCMFCPFQRLYEWVGLLEHHPKLFDRSQQIEEQCGNCKSELHTNRKTDYTKKDFFWHLGWPLANIRKESERLFTTRVNEVYKELVENRGKPRHELELISTTSCGGYCGK